MLRILKVYADCVVRTPKLLFRSPWVVALPVACSAIATAAAGLLAPLGMVGGFILGLIDGALAAACLYVIAQLVAGQRVSPADLPSGTQRFFWPVMNVGFVVWIASMVINLALANAANGAAIQIALMGVLLILLNATPEAIYLRRVFGGLEIFSSAFLFIQEHWLEWFAANIPLLALYLVALPLVEAILPFGVLGSVVRALVEGAAIMPIFVFRGLLFESLDGARRMPWARRA